MTAFDDANCYINKQYDGKMLLMLTITGKSVLMLEITIIFLLISVHIVQTHLIKHMTKLKTKLHKHLRYSLSFVRQYIMNTKKGIN